MTKCKEPAINQVDLDKQISSLLQKFSLKKEWVENMKGLIEKDKLESSRSSAVFVEESKEEVIAKNTKLKRLLDSYLDQDIERETYLAKKAELMSEKKSLEKKTPILKDNKQLGSNPCQNG